MRDVEVETDPIPIPPPVQPAVVAVPLNDIQPPHSSIVTAPWENKNLNLGTDLREKFLEFAQKMGTESGVIALHAAELIRLSHISDPAPKEDDTQKFFTMISEDNSHSNGKIAFKLLVVACLAITRSPGTVAKLVSSFILNGINLKNYETVKSLLQRLKKADLIPREFYPIH